MAVLRRAIVEALLWQAAAEDRGIVRFANDDACAGALLPQHPGNAFQRAARAVAGDPVIKLAVREGLEDLGRRRARMRIGVSLVLELAHQEPAVFLCQFDSLGQHAAAL